MCPTLPMGRRLKGLTWYVFWIISMTLLISRQFLVDGETRSKFYSSQRFIDDQRHCKK